MPLGREVIRHRFGIHEETEVTSPLHKNVSEAYIALCEYLDAVLPDGRPKSSAFTKMQESAMWAGFSVDELAPVKQPTAPQPQDPPLF